MFPKLKNTPYEILVFEENNPSVIKTVAGMLDDTEISSAIYAQDVKSTPKIRMICNTHSSVQMRYLPNEHNHNPDVPHLIISGYAIILGLARESSQEIFC